MSGLKKDDYNYNTSEIRRVLFFAGRLRPLLHFEKHNDLPGPLVGVLADPEQPEVAEEGGGDRVARLLRPLLQLQKPGDLRGKTRLASGIWRVSPAGRTCQILWSFCDFTFNAPTYSYQDFARKWS